MYLIQLDWFSLAILASIASSMVEVFKKAVLKNDNIHPIAFAIYFNILVSLGALPFVFSGFSSLHLDFFTWLMVFFMGFLYAVSNIFYYYALKMTEVSQVGIISASRSIWLLIGGFIFLGETINTFKIAGAFLIVFGIMIVYWEGKSTVSFGKPQIFLLIFAVISCIPSIIAKHLLDNHFSDIASFQVLSYFIPAVFNAILMPCTVLKIKPLLKINKNNAFVIISSLLTTFAIFIYFTALKAGGQISVVGPIWQGSIILTVILGILFLNERQNLLRKLISIALVFISIYFIKFIQF